MLTDSMRRLKSDKERNILIRVLIAAAVFSPAKTLKLPSGPGVDLMVISRAGIPDSTNGRAHLYSCRAALGKSVARYCRPGHGTLSAYGRPSSAAGPQWLHEFKHDGLTRAAASRAFHWANQG
jgi:hypothetical protein